MCTHTYITTTTTIIIIITITITITTMTTIMITITIMTMIMTDGCAFRLSFFRARRTFYNSHTQASVASWWSRPCDQPLWLGSPGATKQD